MLTIKHPSRVADRPPRTASEVHRFVDQLLAAQPPEPEQPTAPEGTRSSPS
jgi:hypothetical protein